MAGRARFLVTRSVGLEPGDSDSGRPAAMNTRPHVALQAVHVPGMPRLALEAQVPTNSRILARGLEDRPSVLPAAGSDPVAFPIEDRSHNLLKCIHDSLRRSRTSSVRSDWLQVRDELRAWRDGAHHQMIPCARARDIQQMPLGLIDLIDQTRPLPTRCAPAGGSLRHHKPSRRPREIPILWPDALWPPRGGRGSSPFFR